MPIVIIAKNTSINDLNVGSLGVWIPALGQRTLTGMFSLSEISDSYHLKDLVIAATIIINDGTADLSSADGLKHISLQSEYEDEADEVHTGHIEDKEYAVAMAIVLG